VFFLLAYYIAKMDPHQESFEENYEENYDEDFNGSLCSLRHVIIVLAKYVIYGLVVPAIVRYAPVYGAAISEQELVVIGAVAAGVILVGEKVVPKTSTLALKMR
jgi:hypothetical protein